MTDSGIDGREVLARGGPIFGTGQRMSRGAWDFVGPLCMAALCTIGVLFIYSAQHFNGGSFWMKQLVWLAVGGSV